MNYKTLDDGSIAKIVDHDEAVQRIADLEAAMNGARASIAAYTAAKQAEIDALQAEFDALQPVLKAAVDIVAAKAAPAVVAGAPAP